MKKKIIKIILIILVLLIVLVAGFIGYLFLKREYEISKLPDYYQELAKKCKEKGSFGCCITSVRNMQEGSYKLIPENGCPEGFQGNGLECIGSYGWCEPIEKPCAKEGETIGAQGMPESCCSGLKQVSGWPGGYEGDCSIPSPPTGLSICTNCGNEICEIDNGENKCNCPEDCE